MAQNKKSSPSVTSLKRKPWGRPWKQLTCTSADIASSSLAQEVTIHPNLKILQVKVLFPPAFAFNRTCGPVQLHVVQKLTQGQEHHGLLSIKSWIQPPHTVHSHNSQYWDIKIIWLSSLTLWYPWSEVYCWLLKNDSWHSIENKIIDYCQSHIWTVWKSWMAWINHWLVQEMYRQRKLRIENEIKASLAGLRSSMNSWSCWDKEFTN